MLNISDYLHEKYGVWGWMGQRAHDAEGINRIFPLDFIISCDYGLDLSCYFRDNDVFSLEKQLGVRKDWSNEDLSKNLKEQLGKEIFERWNAYGKPVNLLCYRSVEQLENTIDQLAFKPKIYAVPERLKTYFDDKVLLYNMMPELGLPRMPGNADRLGVSAFTDLCKELSLPFVVQFPYGSSGHFTFIVREEKDYEKLKEEYLGAIAVIRKYMEGFSLNVNAVIVSTEHGPKTICSFPSVQIAGVPECSNFSTSFCGNDFALAGQLEQDIIKQVENQIYIVGGWMAKSGYRGIFGMDFIFNDGVLFPVEINPRFQNSTSLFTALKAGSQSKEETLFLLHAAEFLQEEDETMKEYIRKFPVEELLRPINGAQLIVHNRLCKSVVTENIIPGVYRSKNGKLQFIKKAASIDACENQKDILITCGIPARNTVIEPNAPVCKVQMKKNVLDPTNRIGLSAETKKIVTQVYNKLGLKDADEVEKAECII